MTTYIYSYRTSKQYEKNVTGPKIAERCGFRQVCSLRRIRPITHRDILIRYGRADWVLKDKGFAKVYNLALAIRRNCNKFFFMKRLNNNGLNVPKIWTNPKNITKFPVLRRRFHHSRGTDIRIINNAKSIVRGDYYLELLSNYREYRVTLFKDKCIRISLKVNPDKHNNKSIIKNTANGWSFKDNFNHKVNLEKAIIEQCKKAFNLSKLDFGAVDVLVSMNESGKPPRRDYSKYIYVLEVNSAPRLSRFGVQLLSYHFLEDLGLKPSISEFDRVMVDGRKILPIKFRRQYVS